MKAQHAWAYVSISLSIGLCKKRELEQFLIMEDIKELVRRLDTLGRCL